jgi:hypothetical protein
MNIIFKTTLLFLLFNSFNTFATVQQKDILIFEGKSYPLQDYFLEDYFIKNPDKRPKSELQSSSLWRGYVAVFEILNGQLYLIDLKIKVRYTSTTSKFDSKFISAYKQFQSSEKPFKVDWVNNLILIPIGDAKYYETKIGLTYDSYKLLEFKAGKIIFNKKFNLQKYRLFIGEKYFGFLEQDDLKKLKRNLSK